MSTLSDYWPTQAHVDQCIRTEAETADDAVLLAVHTPGPLWVRASNATALESAREQDLFDALMRPADDGSAVLVAITGESGAGKSHMVRWLNAQLSRHPDRDRLVVVLVPKTASLRQVVELILAPLEGAHYTHLRTELTRAVEALQPEEASGHLATSLAWELKASYRRGTAALAAADVADRREIGRRAALAQGLAQMLSDPVVYERWLGRVLERIVRSTLGGTEAARDASARRFDPEDLRVPDDWDTSLATQDANRQLLNLQKNDGQDRPLAAELLQDALDPALRKVFRFSEALGQRSIEDIVDDIRRHLLTQNRELVLLIEDFAALAGIQQPLLNLIIAESDHQGVRVRAPLRTALAVTDGFLPSRQTILTRARREWIVSNPTQTEDAILARLVDMTGRYLNAARWGLPALRQQFRDRTEADLDGWVREFDAEHDLAASVSEQLAAFGRSERYPLFPFSVDAVRSLAQRELRQGENLVLNPRTFINRVLREVLLHRDAFLAGTFPPIHFKQAALSLDAERDLRTRPFDESTRGRLVPTLVYWAGNPANLRSTDIPRPLFTAFGLPFPFGEQTAPVVPPPPPDRKQILPPPPPQPAPLPTPEAPPTTDQDEAIASWVNNQPLAQQAAREVRAIVAQALSDRLDWNSLRMRKQSITLSMIWLPFARVGNPTTEPAFRAGGEQRPLAFATSAGVLALCRWEANKRSWNYAGAEDDYPAAQMLLDHLEPQAVSFFSALATQRIRGLLRTLHRQALLLRLTRASDPGDAALADYFKDLPVTKLPTSLTRDDSQPEAQIQIILADATKSLPEIQDALKGLIGCFQGSGPSLHAVDPQRLRAAWRTRDDQTRDPLAFLGTTAARQTGLDLGHRAGAVVSEYQKVFDRRLPGIQQLVGDDPSADLLTPLKDLRQVARLVGAFDPSERQHNAVDNALTILSKAEIQNIIRRAVAFVPASADQSLDAQLATCASLDLALLHSAADALDIAAAFVARVQHEANTELTLTAGGDVAEGLDHLRADLQMLADEEAVPHAA